MYARGANVLVGVPLDGTAVARGAGAGGGARLVDGEAGGHDGLKQREWNEKNAGLYIYMDVLTSGGKNERRVHSPVAKDSRVFDGWWIR